MINECKEDDTITEIRKDHSHNTNDLVLLRKALVHVYLFTRV